MSWPFQDSPPAMTVLAAYLRGESVDVHDVKFAIETLMEAWDSAAAHAEHCHDKLGLPRFRPATREALHRLAEEVRVWNDRLNEEPLDTALADEAQWHLETMRGPR